METGVRLPEVYRYLGYRGAEPDEQVKQAVLRCVEELKEAVNPVWISRTFELSAAGRDELCFAGQTVRSRSLARNLKGCTEVCLLAATLGTGADRLIARAQVIRMSDAVILQAASASMIECLCDRVCREIAAGAEGRDLFCRPRFSPGYGDFPLDFQHALLRVLDAPKRIGVTLTDGMLMSPSKSVTAVMGLSPEKKPCVLSGCEMCTLKECAYRRFS